MGSKKPFRILGPLTVDEIWQIYLNEGLPGLERRAPLVQRTMMRLENRVLKTLPSNPRCMWCNAPFRGMGAPIMRAIGKSQSSLNPNLCVNCEAMVLQESGGAEVHLTILFADVRGSTTLAENISPSEFSRVINRFYTVATDQLVAHQALIEKLIGDEVTAFFVPGLAGPQHAAVALQAARAVLEATGHGNPDGPWAPVGIGFHTGVAYVGAVGSGAGVAQLSVLGDVANTAARLASQAGPGEILFSREAAENGEIETEGLEQRSLTLKGKEAEFKTWVTRVSAGQPALSTE